MGKCKGKQKAKAAPAGPCRAASSLGASSKSAAAAGAACPVEHFENMIPNCLEYATAAKQAGRPIVGIMCEFTPREVIMAAGGVPVCLCGGSADTIPAAEEHLPANLCPLIKSTYGYHVQGTNPFLEMADLIVAETTCDGKKKMYELMAQTRPMHVLELPQKQDQPEALDRWAGEVRGLKDLLEDRFGVSITDEKLREAIEVMNRERALRRELADLMKQDRPPITGRQLLDFKSIISGVGADLEQYARAIEMYRAQAGEEAGSPPVRVLVTGVPMAHGAERVMDLIEGHGGLVVCMESCTGLKPILDDVDARSADPIRAVAEKYYHLPCSVMTVNERRMESLQRLAAEFRPQCVIELVWQACLTYDVESYRVRQWVEKELEIPYLRIETDYSPSDSARISVRVEALFETARRRVPAPSRQGDA